MLLKERQNDTCIRDNLSIFYTKDPGHHTRSGQGSLTAVLVSPVVDNFGFLAGGSKKLFPVYCVCIAQVSVS